MAWPPTAAPICATSPTAFTAVVTSSVPVGPPASRSVSHPAGGAAFGACCLRGAFGFAEAVVLGLAEAVVFGLADAVALGLAFAVVFGRAVPFAFAVAFGRAVLLAFVVLFALAVVFGFAPVVGVAFAVVFAPSRFALRRVGRERGRLERTSRWELSSVIG